MIKEEDFYAEHVLLFDNDDVKGATLRGVQVLRSIGNRDEQLSIWLGEDPENRRSASFLVKKLGTGQVLEWPSQTSHGRDIDDDWVPDPITPTFFRGEVLSRFKRHPEKYEVMQTSIDCRGAEYLRSYDVNDSGQVHAYLKDSWALPYREQLYWRAFNEAPKSGLSGRSIAQDFEVRYWDGPDPLGDLNRILSDFPSATHDENSVAIWAPDAKLASNGHLRLHYVVTDSPKDWAEEILALAKLVVEGIEVKPLGRIARALGSSLKNDSGSIRLLHSVLKARDVDEEIVERIHGPLFELNRLRSKAGIAHRGSEIPLGDLRLYCRELMADIARAMEELACLIRAGVFNLPAIEPGTTLTNSNRTP